MRELIIKGLTICAFSIITALAFVFMFLKGMITIAIICFLAVFAVIGVVIVKKDIKEDDKLKVGYVLGTVSIVVILVIVSVIVERKSFVNENNIKLLAKTSNYENIEALNDKMVLSLTQDAFIGELTYSAALQYETNENILEVYDILRIISYDVAMLNEMRESNKELIIEKASRIVTEFENTYAKMRYSDVSGDGYNRLTKTAVESNKVLYDLALAIKKAAETGSIKYQEYDKMYKEFMTEYNDKNISNAIKNVKLDSNWTIEQNVLAAFLFFVFKFVLVMVFYARVIKILAYCVNSIEE